MLKLIIQKASELISYNVSTYWNDILFFSNLHFRNYSTEPLELDVACHQGFVLENIFKNVK